MIPAPGTDRNKLVGTTAGLLVGGLAFFLTLFDYTVSLTRTALASGFFSQFYDLQARPCSTATSTVPDRSLGIEGFVRGGQTFMYFPPWPAILRLPVLMTTHEYDGRLSLLSMALAWIVFAVMVVKLVWLLVPVLAGLEEVSRHQRGSGRGVPRRSPTGGTFLTFDAAQPWVYHEAYLWAVAAVVGGIYWLVRLLDRPHAARGVVAVRLRADQRRHPRDRGLGAVPGRRSRVGLFMRFRPDRRPRAGPVVAGAARRRWCRCWSRSRSTSTSSAASTSSRCRTRSGPSSTSTAATRSRPTAAAITGPQFFTTSFMAYLRPDGIRFTDYFPFITPARARRAGVQRGLRRPELPHRQRHGVHAAAAADVPGRLRRGVPARAPARRWPGCGSRCWSRSW